MIFDVNEARAEAERMAVLHGGEWCVHEARGTFLVVPGFAGLRLGRVRIGAAVSRAAFEVSWRDDVRRPA